MPKYLNILDKTSIPGKSYGWDKRLTIFCYVNKTSAMFLFTSGLVERKCTFKKTIRSKKNKNCYNMAMGKFKKNVILSVFSTNQVSYFGNIPTYLFI